MKTLILALLATSLAHSAGVFDQRVTRGNPFDQPGLRPLDEPVQMIGGTSSGCILGASQLNLNSDEYIVMNEHRNAYWGHPHLVHLVEKWSREVQERFNGKLKIMDMGLPFGGPATPRHASHQLGIDVDIALKLEPRDRDANDVNRYSSPQFGVLKTVFEGPIGEREIYKYVLDARVTAYFSQQTYELVKHVATHPDVNRIFINPSIREKLCEFAKVQERADRIRTESQPLAPESLPTNLAWLRKVRFVSGHSYHMHIRMHRCAGKANCERPLAPPYQGTDWGLGCEVNRGPNQYWLAERVYYLDPSKAPLEITTFLQQKAYAHYCTIDRRFCSAKQPQAWNEDRKCYDIDVLDQNLSPLFNIRKCVPKACAEKIESLSHL